MAETTELVISNLKIHGSGVANCGSYPDVKVSATIKFTRANPNDTTINWEVSSISWSHPTSGSYGFKFRCYLYLSIPGTYYELIMKNNTTASNWWKYTTLKKPSGSFTAGEGVTTISASIRMHGGSDSCTSGSDHHLCYGSSTYRNIKTYTVTLPTFAPYYTISYNNNGGVGTIESQIKEPEQDINLTTDIPSFPVTITYHDNPDRIETTERPFLNWLGNGTQYAPGVLYTADASCEMVAQWGNATFTPVLPTKYVRITYSLDGGILDPSYIDIARASLGYDPDSTVTSNPQYPNATECTTTSAALSLYPIYGNATMLFANLPTPVKPGYRFEGWFFDSTLQTPVESDISTAVDMTLYASWTFIPVRKFENNNWQEDDLYVWVFNGTAWQKIAPIYAFNGTSWANMSGGPAPVEVTTAKASIANFTTSLARPLVNLTAYFNATQEAGTPTPSSPLPISGWSEISLVHCGNKYKPNIKPFSEWERARSDYYISRFSVPNTIITVNLIDKDTTVDLSGISFGFVDSKWDTKTPLTTTKYRWFIQGGTVQTGKRNISAGDASIILTGLIFYPTTEATYNKLMARYDYEFVFSETSDVEPYSTEVINLGGTYYGGHFTQNKDGHRQLTVTYGVADISELSWNRFNFSGVYCFYVQLPLMKTNYAKGLSSAFEFKSNIYNPNALSNNQFLLDNGNHNGYCYLRCDDYSDVASFKTAMVGQKLIYELATPYTIDLPDGEPITAFNGVNNIYNNSSDSQVTFLATPEEAEAAQQRSLSKGSPSEEPEEEEEKPEEEPIEEPKDTGNER